MSEAQLSSQDRGELILIFLASNVSGSVTFDHYVPGDIEGYVSDVGAVFAQPDADPLELIEELEQLEERGRVMIDRTTIRKRSSGSKGKVIPSAVRATVQLA